MPAWKGIDKKGMSLRQYHGFICLRGEELKDWEQYNLPVWYFYPEVPFTEGDACHGIIHGEALEKRIKERKN